MTSIAAMEFEARCVDVQHQPVTVSSLGELPGPFIIEVRAEDHAALLDVLTEIIAEQDEFDAMLEQGTPWTWKRVLLSLIAMAGVAIILWMSLMPR